MPLCNFGGNFVLGRQSWRPAPVLMESAGFTALCLSAISLPPGAAVFSALHLEPLEDSPSCPGSLEKLQRTWFYYYSIKAECTPGLLANLKNGAFYFE